MSKRDKMFVYIRDIKTQNVVETIEFTETLTQQNIDRLETRLLKRLDLNTNFIDTSTVTLVLQRKRC